MSVFLPSQRPMAGAWVTPATNNPRLLHSIQLPPGKVYQDEAQEFSQRSLEEGGGEFMKLLDSLEERVDLMAKMQETRQRLQEAHEPENGEELLEPTVSQAALHLDLEPSALYLPEEIFAAPDLSANQELWKHMEKLDAHLRTQNEACQRLQAELQEERRRRHQAEQAWAVEREQLNARVRELRQQLNQDASPGSEPRVLIQTMQDLEASSCATEAAGNSFSHICGSNIELEEEGLVARRRGAARQCVAFGATAMAYEGEAWRYRLRLRETCGGTGGLGIGVVQGSPSSFEKLPDKAWRLPQSSLVGYWGCAFIDGKELQTNWRSDEVSEGSCLTVVVSDAGDLKILVDDLEVVHIEGALSLTEDTKLYPVIDLFGTTVAVELLPECKNLTGASESARNDSTSTIAPPSPSATSTK